MNEDRPGSSPTPDGRAQRSWLDKISQVLSGEPKDRDELMLLLRESEQRHVLDPDSLRMIEGVLEVSEMQVRDIMVPRTQMAIVKREQTPEEFLPHIVETAHSRFPVIGDNPDEIEGILLAKDLLPYFNRDIEKDFDFNDLLRPAVFIPESKRLNVLLNEFRASRNHMAIVVDEYGGIAGLVTIEDVLEQIVGEIEDEHDIEEAAFITKFSETRYSVKALTPIEDFNEAFAVNLSDDEFDTIGGLVVNSFGHMPKRGETLNIGLFSFMVQRADSRRVHLLQLTLLDESAKASSVNSSDSGH